MSAAKRSLQLVLPAGACILLLYSLTYTSKPCLTYTPPGGSTNLSRKSNQTTAPPTNRESSTPSEPVRNRPVYNLSDHRILYHQQGLDLYLHAAFLDDRFTESVVRILGMQKNNSVRVEFTCKWEYQDGPTSVASEVLARKVLIDPTWPPWSPFFAVSFDCHFPLKMKPERIKLVSRDGAYSYTLPIERILHRKPRRMLAICVKPMTGAFSVARLVEWFEIQRLAGYADFIMYDTEVKYSSRFVLSYYESLGLLQTLPFAYLMALLQRVDSPEVKPEDRYAIYQQTYLVAMHDCLYRFRGLYQHILFIDTDEVLLPTGNTSIIDLLNDIRRRYTYGAGFMFNTAWHFEENQNKSEQAKVPDYMYMFKNVVGTIPVDNQPKSIIVTDRAISVNFHTILDVPSRGFSNEMLPWQSTAYLHHFRGRCDEKFEPWRCKDLFSKERRDLVLPRYKEQLDIRVRRILDQLILAG